MSCAQPRASFIARSLPPGVIASRKGQETRMGLEPSSFAKRGFLQLTCGFALVGKRPSCRYALARLRDDVMRAWPALTISDLRRGAEPMGGVEPPTY